MLKHDIKVIIAIALMTIVTHGVAPDWCSWVTNSVLGLWLQWMYNFLTAFSVVRVVVAGLLFMCGLYWAWHIFNDRDIRWYRPALLLWVCVLLFDHNILQFVQLWEGFDFRNLAVVIAILIMIGMLGKLVNKFCPYQDRIFKWWKENKNKKETKSNMGKSSGFPNDDIKPQHTPIALQQYAETIAEQLLETNLDKHSFAVGITGEWGSGKTTFLELLESKLINRSEVITFNPWMCRTPEQVIDDFFATLQQQLSPRHSSLSKPIRDYAKFITNATLSWGHGLFSKLTFAFPQDSLQAKKKRLSERFALLKKPVVVIIDDLDRLESSEVFEVLRLIRNTADLRNTIYVVAYDKEYVTCVLKSKNIMEPATYLEKIFPVEIHQPKVEDYQIIQVLYNDLKRLKLFNGNFADELIKRIKPGEKQLIVKILGNYRQTRRFVRVYSLNVQYIQRAFTNEIKLTNLFWMELLQLSDKAVYDTLGREPSKLLYLQGGRYKLRPGIKEEKYISESDKEYKYDGEKIWKEDTPQILELLFGKYCDNVTPSSICHRENYEKFFTLGVSPYKLSKHDFRFLFTQKGEEEKTVKDWVNEGKYHSSIIYQFENCDVQKYNDNDLKTYIVGIMSYGLIVGENNFDVGLSVHSILEKQRYKSTQYSIGKRVVLDWFDEKMRQKRSPVVMTKLLNRLYLSTEYDENGRDQAKQPLLIDNNDVERLLQQILSDYLNNHPELTPLNIFDEKSEIGKVFGNCSVQTDDRIMFDEYNSWKNVGISVIINHYKGHNKLPLEDEKDAISKMFMDDMLEYDSDPDYQDIYDQACEYRARQMDEFFGSNKTELDKLVQACFASGVSNVTTATQTKSSGAKSNKKKPKKKKNSKKKH